MAKLYRILPFFLLLAFTQLLLANSAAYEQRRTDYINTALTNFNGDAITLQAYQHVPVDTGALNSLLAALKANETADFAIVKLVRVLCLSSGQYDTLILPVLDSIPFWLTKSDTVRGYWSENHMSQWMSSNWLLHEKYNKPADANLDYRLRHYLRLKVQFGFYEFFSSVYAPYCLTGLLNLADFAQDAEIKTLATRAAERLLKDILLLTNDKGTFYPVAGRNYYSKYETPYGQNHNNLIYLLTGFGQAPTGCSHAGGFLASSSIEVDSIINSWTPQLDFTYHIGHTLDTGFIINSGLAPLDKTLFQWSCGAYFHPSVAAETAHLLTDSNLWHHVDFEPFRSFSVFGIPTIVSLSNYLNVASQSTVISGQDVSIFKRNSVTLSSIHDFWKGKLGYQQFPVVANVGTTPVFTATGKVELPWRNRSSNNANEHLPYVQQHSNVALIMYRPEFKPDLLPYSNYESALYFKQDDYDEVQTDSMWLLGRQQQSYVAVRRYCLDTINGVPGCPMAYGDGQAWVIVVGDSTMYGSFSNFQNIIHQSQFEDKWYFDTLTNEVVYYAKVEVDTATVQYAWGVDTSTATGIKNITANKTSFTLFPNPAYNTVSVDLSFFKNQEVSIKIINAVGQQVFAETVEHTHIGNPSIPVANFASGVYLFTVECNGQRYTQKLLIQQ